MLKETVENKVDLIITTFLREECLDRLLQSIFRVGLKNSIYIGEQNNRGGFYSDYYSNKYIKGQINVLELPYDCGLSKTRNKLVESTNSPYILLLEDDFEFTDEADIIKMVELMEMDKSIGVVGGKVEQNNIPINFEFYPEIKDGILYHKSDGDKYKEYKGIMYKETGCVLNFALFRREVFDKVLWDDELKLREHVDFYLRLAQTDWKVIYTPEVVIKDAKVRACEEYRRLKARDQFFIKMMNKHNIHKIKYLNGHCVELKDGKIVKYSEPVL